MRLTPLSTFLSFGIDNAAPAGIVATNTGGKYVRPTTNSRFPGGSAKY
jgi:hypothetical protein